MIVRIWQGWTTHENADEYERLLTKEIIPEIRAKGISGLLDIEVFRLETENETEFMTKYCFADLDSIKSMSGDNPEKAYVPERAQLLLKRFEASARHFEKKYWELLDDWFADKTDQCIDLGRVAFHAKEA